MSIKTENEIMKIERLIPQQVTSVKKILMNKHGLALSENYDNFIVRCLRVKDGKVEKAVKLVIAYQSSLETLVGMKVQLKPSIYVNLYKKGLVSVLRQRDMLGRRVTLVRSQFWVPDEISWDECVAAIWLMCEHANGEYEDVPQRGYTTIWDFTGFSWQQFWAVNQWRLLQIVKMTQDGVGGKVGAMHTIFHPKAISVLYSSIRPFLKAKLRERIFFHDSVESLHNYINPKGLPEYLGGMISCEEAIDESVLDGLLKKDRYFNELISQGLPSK